MSYKEVYEELSLLGEGGMGMLDSRFVQCHKSFIVNLSCAVELKADSIVLYNGESVPVSARKLKETRTAFTNYVGDNYDDMDDILSATDTIIN